MANWFGILWKKCKKRQYYDSEGWPHPLKGKVKDKKNAKMHISAIFICAKAIDDILIHWFWWFWPFSLISDGFSYVNYVKVAEIEYVAVDFSE